MSESFVLRLKILFKRAKMSLPEEVSAKDVDDHSDVPVSVRAPVTVRASEYMSSFPITTMVGTMSRGAEGYVTVSELAHGVTTSRITSSALTMPSGLGLAYGYANIT